MNTLNLAIAACNEADKAVAAYDAFVFAAVGRTIEDFDFKADMLAADAASACAESARLHRKIGRLTAAKAEAARAEEFRAIAGKLVEFA